MKACMQSSNSTTPCTNCGQRPGELHRPIFKRGAFCPGCCPVCSPAQTNQQPESVGGLAASLLGKIGFAPKPKSKPLWDTPSAPRPRDPFYFDDRRQGAGIDYLQPGGATRLRRGR